jgi:hypothetical protein
MPLFTCDQFSLEIRAIHSGQAPRANVVVGLVDDRVILPLRTTLGATIWRQRYPLPNDQLSPDKRLSDQRQITVFPGQGILLNAGKDVISLERRDCLVLVLKSVGYLTYHWVYDRETLSPIALMDPNMDAGRIKFGLKLLALAPTTNALETCVQLLEHPNHHVRWEAVRQALLIDLRQGKELVARALEDEHPEVREAAALTFRQLSEGELQWR